MTHPEQGAPPRGTREEDAPRRARQDIAVVGLACRVPGAESPDELWHLLAEGRRPDGRAPEGRFATAEVPADVRTRVGQGSYHPDAGRFDARLFRMSDREAAAIDPHQRWTLELAWTALEDAGQDPSAPRERGLGVFVGSMGADWAMEHAARRRGAIGPGTLAATAPSMIAARVSHAFGLHGPSLVVDTGQSSALVAVHHAAQAIRAGDCAGALVTAVNLNLSTENATATASFGGQSPSGRATLFEDDADGYVRGEGGAAVLLRPLADALRDGDRVHAVLRGSAVTHDGSGTLLVPAPEAHARTIRRACAAAGVDPAAVGFVELHGTGTPVGDRAEADALSQVFARSGDTGPAVGSIKTTVGHLEGAAGLLGLVKAVLVVARGTVPGTAGHRGGALARHLADDGITVPASPVPLPPGALAGVSSLGMGGTNCHVVLAPPPAPAEPSSGHPGGEAQTPAPEAVPVTLSAASPESLHATAAALRDWAEAQGELLARPGALASVARTLTTRRARLSQRASFTARSAAELTGRLDRIAQGIPGRAVHSGAGPRTRTAFLFPGQGAQRPGMGSGLLELPGYSARFDAVAAHADPLLDIPLRELTRVRDGAAEDHPLHDTRYTQIALFAHGVALSGCAEDLGVRADVLGGHSVGELTAAHVAGVLDLADAVRLVVARGAAMAEAEPVGAMVSVRAEESRVRETLAALRCEVEIAALNGPSSTVISGDRATVLACAEALRARGYRTRRLPVRHAFHSRHMDPVLAKFRATAAAITYRRPARPVLSNLSGRFAEGADLITADYWVRHIRHTVRFGDGLATLRADGVRLCLELGPTRTLTPLVRAAEEDGPEMTAASFGHEEDSEYVAFLDALTRARSHGHAVRWHALPGLDAAGWTPLPTYRFTGRDHGSGEQAAAASRPSDPAAEAPGPAAQALRDPLALVRAAIAEVLDVADIHTRSADTPLADLGATSVDGLELRAELASRTGLNLAASLVYDHPTPRALAEHIAARLGQRPGGPPRTPAPARPVRRSPDSEPEPDPVVIAAAACRYPGAVSSPEELWRLASFGPYAVGGFPDDRGQHWSDERIRVRSGGFLADVAGFDAPFFGVSPREARAMDPQQRIMLELCWESLERAGIDPRSLHGTETAVFLGAMAGDYAQAAHEAGDELGGHELTGTSNAVLSGRIAYHLGLTGPALTVDTACSSSLVALHLAVRSLLQGECDIALAGGITVMSTPRMYRDFQRLGGLSADGRCRPFSTDADGTVWSEGAGVVVVTRRSEARRRGLPVLAVVAGSAVNQDGASNGLTAPSGTAQRRVIERALADAGLRPSDIDAVEAHGTGTVLGDAVEAQALIDSYCTSRAGTEGDPAAGPGPLHIGSLKALTGHTQAAAGIGGVIAVVEALRHAELPPTLRGIEPTPKVDWPSDAVRVLTEPVPWPRGGRTRRAAVSSFGMSGTNAHLILEDPNPGASQSPDPARSPQLPPGTRSPRTSLPFVVSAACPEALETQLGRLSGALAEPGPGLPAAARTLATRRAALPHRAAVVAHDRAGLLAGLEAARTGAPLEGVARGTAHGEYAVAFVYPGQGSQWPGMGRRLLREAPAFAREVDRCADAFAPHVDFSVTRLIAGEEPAGVADSLEGVQVALFTMMAGLTALWRSSGVAPDLVLGHSQGEVAAAYAAGALTLQDAAAVVATRARLLSSLAGTGAMTVLGLDEDETRRLLAGRRDASVEVAVCNGPGSTVVSGPPEAVEELADHCRRAGIRTVAVAVDYASHSAMVEPVARALTDRLAGIVPRPARVPFFSTTRADWLTGAEVDAGYWYENLRGTVRFADAVAAISDTRPAAFVEVSPHEVLTAPITAVLDGLRERPAPVVGSLRRDQGGYRDFLARLSYAWTQGVPVRWDDALPGGPGPRPRDATGDEEVAALPPTPFRHRRFWIRTDAPAPARPVLPAPPPPTTGAAPGTASAPADAEAAVLARVTEVLQLPGGRAAEEGDRSFRELGLDSLTTIDLRRRIRESLGVPVPIDVFQTHDTPRRLARWVRDHLTTTEEERRDA
ncbi:beta-ketoacyl synthase N-terminal-like domain-containing protein [Streptomyces sp. NPDC048057]|uniref:type I polyketide synthase n=1 Tax=Streptomyces sp. NPDC048057 TaxID=3155628 RepID=UPI0033D6B3DE